MTKWEQVHLPCPCGKSSDAYSINDRGWGKCFSCYKNFNENKEKKDILLSSSEDYRVYGHRGISERTFDFYKVFTKFEDGNPVEVGFTYGPETVKIRSFNEKKFTSTGNMKDATLFGKDKFDPNAFRTISITEGEYDALAVYDMIGRNTAAVSVRSSSSAHSDCKKEWDYINSFDKIILCFDNDEQGNKAAREVASLFDFNKVYRIHMNRHKDANAYLMNKEAEEFTKAWSTARKYTPDNIISSFSDIEKSLEKSDEDKIGTYPIESLNNMLYGLHRGEVIVFKGDPGIGKTEIFRMLEHHLLKTEPKCKIGIIHLEEDEATTVKAIATYEDKYPHVHPEHQSSNKDIMEAYKKAVGNQEDRLFIYESFDVEDEKQLLDNIRFLVSACGCEFIFLDHITWLATGMDNEDERKKLDRISQKLKLLAKELRICILMISHTNDEGKTRGSRNIANVANTVIHMSRDKTNVVEDVRRKTYLMIEKARAGGNTGPAGFAKFNYHTMMLEDVLNEETMKLPGV